MLFDQVIKYYNAATRALTFFGGLVLNGTLALGVNAITQTQQTLTYAASIAWDVGLGALAIVTVTDSVNFAVAAPTNLVTGGFYALTIVNASGGAFGTGTWDAIFKTTGNVPAIADTTQRTFLFYYDGTNLIEQTSAADVAT